MNIHLLSVCRIRFAAATVETLILFVRFADLLRVFTGFMHFQKLIISMKCKIWLVLGEQVKARGDIEFRFW